MAPDIPVKPRERSPLMTLFQAAVDLQQAAAEPKNRIGGCSGVLPESLWEKKVRLNFLSSFLRGICIDDHAQSPPCMHWPT